MLKKTIIRVLAFGLVFAAVFQLLQTVFQAEWPEAMNSYARVKLFYKEKNSPDVVVVGSSHAFEDMNPLVMYKDQGIASYIFSPPVLDYQAIELYVREAIETCHPKVLAIEVFSVFIQLFEESRTRQWLDPLPLSLDKLSTTSFILKNNQMYGREECDSMISYIWPLFRYHVRWKSLSAQDFDLDPDMDYYHGAVHYHGYGPHYENAPEDFSHYYDDVVIDDEALARAKEQIKRCVVLCEENDINLFFVNSPTPRWRNVYHELIDDWAAEFGVPFLDCTDTYEDVGVVVETDFRHEHLNDSGTTKFSYYLGEYLKKNYDLPDHRSDPAYASWDEDWQVYQQDKASYFLSHENDWGSYLEKLQNPNYTVYIIAKDNLGGEAHPELTGQLKELGLTLVTDTAGLLGYMAIIDGGNAVYESMADAPLAYETDINGHHVALASESYYQGNRGSIVIDGIERFVDRRGVGIVVYDNVLEDVVDRVTFDLLDGGKVYR